jgi:HAE1 family hydrophobic/amphiphilic exporter-1
MLLLSLMVVGLVAVQRLPLGFLPEVTEPEIGVEVSFPGSHPLEVSREILEPLEEELAGIPGIKSLEGSARPGRAKLDVRFSWGERMEVKRLEVREAIERVRLPAGAGRPKVEVSKLDGGGAILKGRISATRDLDTAWDLLERRLKRPLERVRGVAAVDLYGVSAQQVRVDLDMAALRQHKIPTLAVFQALRAANLDLDLGAVRDAQQRRDLRFEGRLASLEDLRRVVVRPGVRVGDVAQIRRLSPRLPYGRHLNRRFAVGIDVYKEPSANTVATVTRLRERIREVERDPQLEGVTLLVWNDAAREIKSSLTGLASAGLWGGLFAILVILGFLRRLATTAIVAMAIPFSLLVTAGAMYLLGASLNVLTLLGLMLGVGMLVDNAVVVIENIHRLQAEGLDAREAALEGTRGIFLAVLASTATTVVVWSWLFVADRNPLTIYMGSVALTICLTVLCSLVVSLTFIPLAAAHVVPGSPTPPGPILQRLVPMYRGLLRWTLSHRAVSLLVLLGLAATVVWPLARIEKSGEPKMRQRAVSVGIVVHDPSSKEELETYVNRVEEWLHQRREELGYETLYSWYDERGRCFTQVYLHREDATETGISRLRAQLKEDLPVLPGARLEISDRMWWRGGGGSGQGRKVAVVLRGSDPEYLETLGRNAEVLLREAPGASEVQGPETSGRQEVTVQVRREKARQLGLTPRAVGDAVAFAFRGRRLGRFRSRDGELEVVLGLPPEAKPGLSALRDLPIPRESQSTVPLAAVAELLRTRTPASIQRADRRTSLRLSVTFPEKVTSEEAQARVEQQFTRLALPEGYSWDFGEWGRRRDKSLATMSRGVALSMLVVLLLLVALFQSLSQPLAILVTLPFAFCGAFWVLWGFGYDLDAVGFIGVIILIGIVVNNGIVLVDHVNALREQGLEREAALVKGCGHRLRPILMTAISTLVGLVPLVLTKSTVSGAYLDSLAVAVMGGLATSTLFTLVALPVWYTAVEDLGSALLRLLPRPAAGVPTIPSPGRAVLV